MYSPQGRVYSRSTRNFLKMASLSPRYVRDGYTYQIEEGRLGRVHEEERDEGGDQAEDVSYACDDPVQLVLDS